MGERRLGICSLPSLLGHSWGPGWFTLLSTTAPRKTPLGSCGKAPSLYRSGLEVRRAALCGHSLGMSPVPRLGRFSANTPLHKHSSVTFLRATHLTDRGLRAVTH